MPSTEKNGDILIPVEVQTQHAASLSPDEKPRDPLADLFGPGSAAKLLGEADDDVPDEVRAILDQYGLGKKSFQCVLREYAGGDVTDTAATAYIKGWSRCVPSMEYIARNYGPGNYNLGFNWRGKDDDGKQKACHEEVIINISEKFMEEYKRLNLSRKINEAVQTQTKVKDALIEQKLESEMLRNLTGGMNDEKKVDPADAAKQYISQTIEAARMIGLQPAAATPAVRIEWDKVLAIALPTVTALLKMWSDGQAQKQADNEKFMMMMLNMSNQNNSHMMELVKAQAGAGSGNMAIKEFKDMVLGALDIKEALSGGQKEGLADKIFRMVEAVAPQIMSIAAMTAQARLNNPVVKMTKGYIDSDPDFQQLKKNPAEMKAFCEKMDNAFGWENTNQILEVAGYQRPADCPCDPAKRYAPDDPRNNVEDGDIS